MFNIEKENIDTKYLIVLLSIAYLFSVAVRMIWIAQFSGFDEFYWNNQLMINTNDGYIWATSALNELTQQFENNPRVVDMYHYGVVFFTYLAVKILPFSIDTIILYMPVFISSLIVIPMILIARIYNLTLLGFFSALIGSIAWSYYNRTMAGYYDTDMFAVMTPMFILYFLISSIESKKLLYTFFASIVMAIYPFLYDSASAVLYAIGIMYMLYLVVFHRDEKFTYNSIILVSLSLFSIVWYLNIVLVYIVFLILTKKEIELKRLKIISLVSALSFLIFANVFGVIWAKIVSYGLRSEESSGLKFYQVAQTVREAGKIPFEVMANRISGSVLGVVVSLVGYILLVIKYRPFILALPLVGIGVFSLWGGLRFTVYAVPVSAMGAVYLFYVIASFSDKKLIRYFIVTSLTLLMLFPNIIHIVDYKVPTVFNKQEVKVLDKLKSISKPTDYTIAWWDYGYPIWYYSNTNTLIDGGKHKHDNFIVSKILTTTSQTQSVNLARLAIETYVKSDYKIVADTIFHNKQKNQIDPDTLLSELMLDDYALPKKTRDIYLYLPNRMLNILPTVDIFSNLDLVTGKKNPRPFFYKTSRFKDTKEKILFGKGIELDKRTATLKVGKQSVRINQFIVTSYDKKGSLKVDRQVVDKNSNLSVIFMKNYNQFLIVDDRMLNSTYIKLFVLQEYDKKLFEAVILTPYSKVYKLKI